MQDKPLVSVVCLSMNHAAFIERSFKSLTSQTFRDFEIIYLDNNSTDGSFGIGEKLLKDAGFPYRGFKRAENFGTADNMNFLTDLATGKYIAPLSGDDFWEPDNLEEKVKFGEAHPEFGLIYGGGYKYFYDTHTASPIDTTNCKSGWIFPDLLKGNFINGIGLLIPKNTFEQVGGFDKDSLIEDWELWLRIAEKFQIGFLDKPLVYYGQKTGNNTSANTEYMDKGAHYIFNKYAHHPEIKKAKDEYFLYRVYQHASGKPAGKDLRFILQHFQFNMAYIKQLGKAIYNLIFAKPKP